MIKVKNAKQTVLNLLAKAGMRSAIKAAGSAYVTVNHRAAGAKAVCNTNTHTNSSATTGTTTIHCVTYSMTDQKITKTGSATCKPDVGSPTVDVAVQYRISAYTPTSNDVFWSKGNITKIS